MDIWSQGRFYCEYFMNQILLCLSAFMCKQRPKPAQTLEPWAEIPCVVYLWLLKDTFKIIQIISIKVFLYWFDLHCILSKNVLNPSHRLGHLKILWSFSNVLLLMLVWDLPATFYISSYCHMNNMNLTNTLWPKTVLK